MSDEEEKIAAEIANIEKIAKDDPNIDQTALVTNLLQRKQGETLPAKQVLRSYLVSLFFPPFGLYYVVKFFLRPEPDARRAAWINLALTALAIIIMASLIG